MRRVVKHFPFASPQPVLTDVERGANQFYVFFDDDAFAALKRYSAQLHSGGLLFFIRRVQEFTVAPKARQTAMPLPIDKIGWRAIRIGKINRFIAQCLEPFRFSKFLTSGFFETHNIHRFP